MRFAYAFLSFLLICIARSEGNLSQALQSHNGSNPMLEQQFDLARKESIRWLARLSEQLYRSKRWVEAVEVYKSAFRVRSIPPAVAWAGTTTEDIVSPDDFVIYGLCLEHLHKQKAKYQAIEVMEEGKALYPEHRLIRYNLAVYLMDGDAEAQRRAQKEYNWILDRDPMDAGSLFNRALILMHMGKFEAAAKSLEEAIPVAVEKYGTAWYGETPWLIRQHQRLLDGVEIQPSRTRHLQELVQEALPLMTPHDAWGMPLVLEFGVGDGASLGIIAREVAKHNPSQQVHGFDSFIGLPEAWMADGVGEYSQQGAPPAHAVPKNVQFHSGWFNETLKPFLDRHPGVPVAALHLDADLYSSTIEVLDLLAPRLQNGCVIRFDEYYLLKAKAATRELFDQHEARAWKETMTKYGIQSEPLSWHGQSVTFVVLDNPQHQSQPSNETRQPCYESKI